MGNSLGLHEFLIDLISFVGKVILAQQFFVTKSQNSGMFSGCPLSPDLSHSCRRTREVDTLCCSETAKKGKHALTC